MLIFSYTEQHWDFHCLHHSDCLCLCIPDSIIGRDFSNMGSIEKPYLYIFAKLPKDSYTCNSLQFPAEMNTSCPTPKLLYLISTGNTVSLRLSFSLQHTSTKRTVVSSGLGLLYEYRKAALQFPVMR